MKTVVCDRCGKTIIGKETTARIDGNIVIPRHFGNMDESSAYRVYDMCEDCAGLIVAIIEGNIKVAIPEAAK